MRRPIASAKPNDHKVYAYNKVYKYSRVRKRILTDEQCTLHLLRQVAKVTLRRVKQIFHIPEKLKQKTWK